MPAFSASSFNWSAEQLQDDAENTTAAIPRTANRINLAQQPTVAEPADTTAEFA